MQRILARTQSIQMLLAGVWLALVLTLTGCGETDSERMVQQAVAIESADECHLCGMLITNFVGPKGELTQQGARQVKKFCSTRDLFAYALDPEHRASIESIWVHNMARVPWEFPDDEQFINARDAWFVINSRLKGAMGPALASFAEESDARAFIGINGGELIRFDQVTMDTLNSMGSSMMPAHRGQALPAIDGAPSAKKQPDAQAITASQ
ncbi:nitrous oxide reductase accessory protein NosL [Aestuariirhabdus sp. Z084]|uniref:nitrous oxide reductase accessory protein NosL n=1 Tax=Aestuariirhabdus haliotis TaxID=2918751 RepID=UPI0020C12827|nr:nitrous oxide reductase accessory protein NosL [Aestuariirhabdus haliotis]MCL6416658.1 nitrous oxide reductase accessory protein NosL [Aestuariirhabdus haliotis]